MRERKKDINDTYKVVISKGCKRFNTILPWESRVWKRVPKIRCERKVYRKTFWMGVSGEYLDIYW